MVLQGRKTSYSTINARAEGIQIAASYREPFKTRRCLVPASGYFEWTGPKSDRQPHYFTRTDGHPMALAGLWDRWRSKDKSETKDTFTIVTNESHAARPGAGHLGSVAEGRSGSPAALLKPANEALLVSRPVNKAIGNVKNNGPELLEPPSTPST